MRQEIRAVIHRKHSIPGRTFKRDIVTFQIDTNLWNGKRGLLKNSTLFLLYAYTKYWGHGFSFKTCDTSNVSCITLIVGYLL